MRGNVVRNVEDGEVGDELSTWIWATGKRKLIFGEEERSRRKNASA